MSENDAGHANEPPTNRALPEVRLLPGRHKRARHGHPWVFSNEIAMGAAVKALPPGALVRLVAASGAPLGTAGFNPHSLIAARLFSRDAGETIDRAWIAARLRRALALREALYPGGYYRLVHAEADGLPGLIIDRFGSVVAVQPNTAATDRMWPEILAALVDVLAPKAVIVAAEGAARRLEGLEPRTELVHGSLDGPVAVEENGLTYFAEPLAGQKTGWFYDQRDNRAFVARLAGGARVLDAYCYSGGFAVAGAAGGAASVVGIDRSAPALALAVRAAERNGVAARCEFRQAEVFAELARLAAAGERFEIVVADPPAFAKSRRELRPALRGYRKLARLAAAVTGKEGILFLASCSHHVTPEGFQAEVARGLDDAGRGGRILRAAGAAADHPAHPHLPESAYLKALVLALD